MARTWRHYLPPNYFRDTAVVYSENAGTGAFDVVVNAALACRLNTVNRQNAATAPDRAQLAASREVHSDPDFTPNVDAIRFGQFAIGADRWNPAPDSFVLERADDPAATPIYWRFDVVKAGT